MADHASSAAARERIDILADKLMKAMLNAPEPDWAQRRGGVRWRQWLSGCASRRRCPCRCPAAC